MCFQRRVAKNGWHECEASQLAQAHGTGMDAQSSPRHKVEAARCRVAAAAEELRRQSQQRLQSAVRSRDPEERVIRLIAVATCLEPCTTIVSIVARSLLRSWKRVQCMSGNALETLVLKTAADASHKRKAAQLLAGPAGSRTRLRVGRLIAEARVAAWLNATNERGVAASTSQLVARLRTSWPPAALSPAAMSFLLRLRVLRNAQRNFANRFRARWGVSWKRLPARADLSGPELASRARRGGKSHDQKGTHFWNPVWSPNMEAHDTVHERRSPNVESFWVPFLGHCFVHFAGANAVLLDTLVAAGRAAR